MQLPKGKAKIVEEFSLFVPEKEATFKKLKLKGRN